MATPLEEQALHELKAAQRTIKVLREEVEYLTEMNRFYTERFERALKSANEMKVLLDKIVCA